MNILIINAFERSPSGKALFNSFVNLIKRIFKSISKKSGIDNFYYTYKDPLNIDDYIYDYDFNPNEGTKANLSSKKNFDKIDIVFIDGTEKYLPWEDNGYKLSQFIRLCKSANKPLYAGGVALEILIYYLATGSHNEMNFINSKGEIQSIEDIHKIPKTFLNELKKNDKFLDFVTGDVLEYRALNQTWIPILNIGLHKQITSEKYMSRGKFVLPDKFISNYYNNNTIVSNCKELKLTIKKQFLSHWSVNNLPIDFVVYSTLNWFPHYFNVGYEKFQFKTICESIKGPFVIEHENTLAVGFHVMNMYKESIKILENFIKKNYKKVQNKLFQLPNYKENYSKEKELPNMFKQYRLNDEIKRDKIKNINEQKLYRPLSSIEKVNNSRPFSKILKVKKIPAYCGMGFNNRNMIFVDDNSINQVPISRYGINYNKLSIDDKTDNNKRKKYNDNNIDTLKPNENTRISQLFKISQNYNNVQKHSLIERNIIDNLLNNKQLVKVRDEMNKHEQNAEDYMIFIDKEKMEEEQMINYYKKMRKDICQKLDEINQASEYRINKIDKLKLLSEQRKKRKKNNKGRYLSNKTGSNFYKIQNTN